MRKIAKENLVKQVIVGARENSIGVVLFHQVVGRILGAVSYTHLTLPTILRV